MTKPPHKSVRKPLKVCLCSTSLLVHSHGDQALLRACLQQLREVLHRWPLWCRCRVELLGSIDGQRALWHRNLQLSCRPSATSRGSNVGLEFRCLLLPCSGVALPTHFPPERFPHPTGDQATHSRTSCRHGLHSLCDPLPQTTDQTSACGPGPGCLCPERTDGPASHLAACTLAPPGRRCQTLPSASLHTPPRIRLDRSARATA
mmetsp:Transcript_15646/g.35965  ORF Transcript_15646/g.35965 Transcript_15646/m.35965 type:complete len:204 (-) Transcript_15646:2913-3524(-)